MFFKEPHVVIHFAVQKTVAAGTGYSHINENGTSQLLQKMPQSCLGILYGSSLSVYGNKSQDGINEQAPLKPQSDLGRSRVAAEKLIMENMQALDKFAFLLRPRMMIGKNDQFTFKGLNHMIRKNVILGDGSQKISVIETGDYAAIMLQLVDYIFTNKDKDVNKVQPLHIGYNEPITMQQIVEIICRIEKLQYPQKLIKANPVLLKLLKLLPIKSLKRLAYEIELTGLSHYGNVEALESLIGSDITRKHPAKIFEQQYKKFK